MLRSEVDNHGYDLVIEANGQVRHAQLKGLRRGGKRSEVAVSIRLAAKRSGCVVWMLYDPATLALGPFLWFGGAPGEALPDLGTKIARYSKGNAQGTKTARPGHRVVRRGAFREITTIAALADALFGPTTTSTPGAASRSVAAAGTAP